jgi:hypothetical protein
VHEGSISPEKARLVVRACGPGSDEEARSREATLLAVARRQSVRGLRALLGHHAPAEEAWQELALSLTEEDAGVVLAALDVAGLVLERGPVTPRWERLRAICQEYLGSAGGPIPEIAPDLERGGYDVLDLLAERPASVLLGQVLGDEPPVADEDAGDPGNAGAEPVGAEAALLEDLEVELRRWDELTRMLPVPQVGDALPPMSQLGRELRELARMRAGWDERIGCLCRLVQVRGTFRAAGHGSSEACCADLLGVSERSVRSRIALERKLTQMPPLREALRSGRLTFEKARQLSFHTDPQRVDADIERAVPLTAIELRRQLEEEADRKMSGGGELRVPVPEEVVELLEAVSDTIRENAGCWVPAGKCLVIASLHFLGIHGEEARRNLRKMGPIRRRDGGRCRVPGCSRAAGHVHHRRLRGQGGGDEPENLISVCPPHHLRGLHRGFVRVVGSAPDGLTWWLGEDAVRRSYEEHPEP